MSLNLTYSVAKINASPNENIIRDGKNGTRVISIVQWKVTPWGILMSITIIKAIKENPKFTVADNRFDVGKT